MDLVAHFRLIWRRRWRVLSASVLVASLVWALSASRPAVYRAKALVSVTSGRALAGENVTEQDTIFLTRNYAELARTRPVLADAAARSGVRVTVAQARQRLSARAADDVGFLTLSADGPSPAEATALARAGAAALLAAVAQQQSDTLRDAIEPVEAEMRTLESQLAAASPAATNRPALEARYQALVRASTDRRVAPTDRLVVVSPARADASPVSPVPGRDAALAFFAAFVVNAELAVVMEVLRDRFTVEEQDDAVTEVTGLPVLAQVPSGGASGTVEAVRTLRTNLMFMQTTEQLRTVAVVSVNPGAGKTFTAVHLALSVAGLDVPVVLVDADLRRPAVHRQVGVDVSPGLSDLLAGSSLELTLQRAPDASNLEVLPAGSPVADPAGLVGGQAFADVLSTLHGAAMVVVDTPASALFADGLAVSSQCDATIVVVDARGTKRRSLRRLIEQLRRVGSNPIGVVVNRVDPPARSSYYSYRPKALADR